MVLGDSVLFPNASLPLHIFEDRYRQMLSAVSDGPGYIAIATRRENEDADTESAEVYPFGSVGMVQVIQKQKDGTSHVLLSGVARVRFVETISQEPFPIFRIVPLATKNDIPQERAAQKRKGLLDLVRRRLLQVADDPSEILKVLMSIPDPEVVADLVAFGFVSRIEQRLKLVSMESLGERLDFLAQSLATEINEEDIADKLRQGLSDDRIGLN